MPIDQTIIDDLARMVDLQRGNADAWLRASFKTTRFEPLRAACGGSLSAFAAAIADDASYMAIVQHLADLALGETLLRCARADTRPVTRIQDRTEPELAELMQGVASAVAARLRESCGEDPLFALLVFNDPKAGQYICNCRREDVIEVLRSTADRLEAREELGGTEFPQ